MVAPGDEPTGALVRPYAVTGGRTRPRVDIAIEALVETTAEGSQSGGVKVRRRVANSSTS